MWVTSVCAERERRARGKKRERGERGTHRSHRERQKDKDQRKERSQERKFGWDWYKSALHFSAEIGFHFFRRPWPCSLPTLNASPLARPPPRACACLCVCLSLTREPNEADSGEAQSQDIDLPTNSLTHISQTGGHCPRRAYGPWEKWVLGLVWGTRETILSSLTQRH